MIPINEALYEALTNGQPWEEGNFRIDHSDTGIYLKRNSRAICAIYATDVLFSDLKTHSELEMSYLQTWLMFTNNELVVIDGVHKINFGITGKIELIRDVAFSHMVKAVPITIEIIEEYLQLPNTCRRVIK